MNYPYLSTHFTIHEASVSGSAARLGLDNSIPPRLIPVIEHTAQCMEGVRKLLNGHAIHVLSWYRNPTVNASVHSQPTSQHILGEAVDFVCPEYGNIMHCCKTIQASAIDFDKLILESSWIHISFSGNPNRKNRKEVYTLAKNGKDYIPGLIEIVRN